MVTALNPNKPKHTQEAFTPVIDPLPGVSIEEALVAGQKDSELTALVVLQQAQTTPVASLGGVRPEAAESLLKVGDIIKASSDGKTFTIYHPEANSTSQIVASSRVSQAKKDRWEQNKNNPVFQEEVERATKPRFATR